MFTVSGLRKVVLYCIDFEHSILRSLGLCTLDSKFVDSKFVEIYLYDLCVCLYVVIPKFQYIDPHRSK